jgi:tetratricopeptide (TPR) repeat protein
VVDPLGDEQLGLRLCTALWWLWVAYGQMNECWNWHRAVLDSTPFRQDAAQCWATWGAGIIADMRSDFDRAEPLLREALTLAEHLHDPQLIAVAHGGLGQDLMTQGRLAEALPLLEQSLAEVREVGPRCYLPIVYYNPARVAFAEGRLDEAAALLDQCIAEGRQLGFLVGLALALPLRGLISIAQGRFDEAEAFLREGAALEAQMGVGVSFTGLPLGQLALMRGDLDASASEFLHVLDGAVASGFRLGTAEALAGLALVLAARGQPQEAAQVFGAVDRMRAEIKTPLQPEDQQRISSTLQQLRAALGDAGFERAWRQGNDLQVDEAIALGRRLGVPPAPSAC